MKIRKHHIVMASLVTGLALAVYLNWQLSPTSKIEKVSVGRELGAATYVSGKSASDDELAVNSPKISSLSSEQAEFFAQSKAKRQKSQEEMITLAKNVVELADSSDDAKEEAVEQLNSLENILLNQDRIEITLAAKGLNECLCTLSDSSCTVLVPKGELKEGFELIIYDCVSDVAKIPFENISIVEV